MERSHAGNGAEGIVRRHADSKGLGPSGDLLGFEQATAMADVGLARCQWRSGEEGFELTRSMRRSRWQEVRWSFRQCGQGL